MLSRRALIYDRDHGFVDLLRSLLDAYGFEIHLASDEEDMLGQVVSLRPDLVFVAVELPDKTGFSLCSRAKGLVKRVPVVLATSSLPWNEMTMHQNLKVHADLYLDKRTVTREELLGKVDTLVSLGATVRSEVPPRLHLVDGGPDAAGDAAEEVLARAADVSISAMPAPDVDSDDAATWVAEFVNEGVDAQSAAALASLVMEGDDEEDEDEADGPAAESATLAGARVLEAEMDRLRHELESAQQAARSSPFSREYSSLKEDVDRQGREIIRLSEKVHKRDRQLARARRKLRDFALKLLPAIQERDRVRQREKGLQRMIETAERDMRNAKEEIEGIRRESTEALRKEQQAHVVALEEVEARGAEALRAAEEAAEALKVAHAEELAAVQRQIDEHSATLVSEQESHGTVQSELSDLRKELARQREDAEEAMRWGETNLADEKAVVARMGEELAALKGQLLRAEQGQAAAVGEADAKLQAAQAQCSALEQQVAAAGSALEHAQVAHQQMQTQLEAELERVRSEHAGALGQAETALADAKAWHAEALEQTREEMERSRSEHAEALAEAQQEIERTKGSQGSALAEHQAQLESLEQGHAEALERALGDAGTEHAASFEQLQKELEATKEELKEAKVQLKHAQADHAGMLKQAEQARVNAQKGVAADQKKALAQALEGAKAEHKEALAKALESAEAKHKKALQDATRKHKKAIDDMTAALGKAQAGKDQIGQEAKTAQAEAVDRAVAAAKEAHDKDLARLKSEHDKALAAAKAGKAKAAKDQAAADTDAIKQAVDKARGEQAEELKKHKAAHDKAMESIRARATAALGKEQRARKKLAAELVAAKQTSSAAKPGEAAKAATGAKPTPVTPGDGPKLQAVMAQAKKLAVELARTKKSMAGLLKTNEAQKKDLSDKTNTIESLEALVRDFSGGGSGTEGKPE